MKQDLALIGGPVPEIHVGGMPTIAGRDFQISRCGPMGLKIRGKNPKIR
jgi:hypothetical protein